MHIALSIVVAGLIAVVLYRVLFEDFDDFLRGVVKVLSTPFRLRLWHIAEPKSEDYVDEIWSAFRFFFLLIVSVGGGLLTYFALGRYF